VNVQIQIFKLKYARNYAHHVEVGLWTVLQWTKYLKNPVLEVRKAFGEMQVLVLEWSVICVRVLSSETTWCCKTKLNRYLKRKGCATSQDVTLKVTKMLSLCITSSQVLNKGSKQTCDRWDDFCTLLDEVEQKFATYFIQEAVKLLTLAAES
jgi:hypothetical protein